MRALHLRLPALLWSWAFAAVHGYWLAGGRLGLPSDVFIDLGSPLFYAAVVAVPLLLAAGLTAVCGEKWLGRKSTYGLLLAVAMFCFVHSVWPLVNATLAYVNGDATWNSERDFYGLTYEINWFLGGVWFALALVGAWLAKHSHV